MIKFGKKAQMAAAALAVGAAFATAANARCVATPTAFTTGGYTVTYDLTIQGHNRIASEIESRFNADAGFRTVRHPAGQQTQNPLRRGDIRNGSDATRVSSGELSRLISDYNRGGTDLINLARELCDSARDRTRVPTVTRTITPTPVETPRITTPRPTPAPVVPPREYHAPETSPRPPQICRADEVQPVIVLQTECDCEESHRQAELLAAAISANLKDVDVVVTEGSSLVDNGPIKIWISVQNEADGTVATRVTSENGEIFSLVNIDDDRDGETDRTALISTSEETNKHAVPYIIGRLLEMKYAPAVASFGPAATEEAPTTAPAVSRPAQRLALCGS